MRVCRVRTSSASPASRSPTKPRPMSTWKVFVGTASPSARIVATTSGATSQPEEREDARRTRASRNVVSGSVGHCPEAVLGPSEHRDARHARPPSGLGCSCMSEMCASKNGVAARQVERKHGVCPQHRVVHLTQRASARRCKRRRLTGRADERRVIVADETFIGPGPKRTATRPGGMKPDTEGPRQGRRRAKIRGPHRLIDKRDEAKRASAAPFPT